MKFATVCSGIGAPEQAWLKLGWKAQFFSEIEPFPCAVLAHHYPDVPNLGDMTKFKDWPDFDLDVICAGTPCFAAGTLVLTRFGLVPIEKVQVGELVLTHKNRWKPVLRIGSKEAPTIIVKGQGNTGIETTEEHPFWSRANSRTWVVGSKKSKTTCWKRNVLEAKWTNAIDMKGMYWGSPSLFPEADIPEFDVRNQEGKNMPKAVDEDFMWFVGAWLGDGWLRMGQKPQRPKGETTGIVLICGNKNEEAILYDKLSKCGFKFSVNQERTTVRFQICSKPVARWLKDNFGEYCEGKKIPSWLLSTPLSLRKAFLDGLLYADGTECIALRGGGLIRKLTTINKQVAIGVRLLANTLGIGSSIVINNPKRELRIEGRLVSEKPFYIVHLFAHSRSAFCADDMMWGKVRQVFQTGQIKTVYNLEVADDNSYTADGVAVHNCQAFSVAGLRKGLSDPRGNLTLVFLGIIDRYKPRYVVWENVPGVLSEKSGALHAFLDGLQELGYVIDPDILDAQFFGVPQRRRRIFVVGHHIDDLLKSKTTATAQTVAQMLGELAILNLLGRETGKFEGETAFLPDGTNPTDLLQRRLKLFKVSTNPMAIVRALEGKETPPELHKGIVDLIPTIPSTSVFMDMVAVEKLVCSWEQVPTWLQILSLLTMESNSCPKKATQGSMTDQQAYALAKSVLHISAYIASTNRLVPTYPSSAALALNALTECLDYARQANCNILADMEWISSWNYFIEQALGVYQAFGYSGDGTDRQEVLSFIQSLSGNNPQSEEEGEDSSEDAGDCADADSRNGGYDCDRGAGRVGVGNGDGTGHNNLIPEVAETLRSRDHKGIHCDVTSSTPIPVVTNGEDSTTMNIYSGNKRKDRPEGGFYVKKEEQSKTLDAGSGLNPSANQGGTVVIQPKSEDKAKGTWWDGKEVASALTTRSNQQFMPDKDNFGAVITPVKTDSEEQLNPNIKSALRADYYKGPSSVPDPGELIVEKKDNDAK